MSARRGRRNGEMRRGREEDGVLPCPPGWACARIRGTPAGDFELVTTGEGLRTVTFLDVDAPGRVCREVPDIPAARHLDRGIRFLTDLLEAGRASETDAPPLDLGTVSGFARSVYHALLAVPAGEVVSYGSLARVLGAPGAARAVGRAVGANPLPLIVPCHRVIRSDGSLGGFGGGLHRKAALLRLEGLAVDGIGAGSRVRA